MDTIMRAVTGTPGAEFVLTTVEQARVTHKAAEHSSWPKVGYVAIFYPDMDSFYSSWGDCPESAVEKLAANLHRAGLS